MTSKKTNRLNRSPVRKAPFRPISWSWNRAWKCTPARCHRVSAKSRAARPTTRGQHQHQRREPVEHQHDAERHRPVAAAGRRRSPAGASASATQRAVVQRRRQAVQAGQDIQGRLPAPPPFAAAAASAPRSATAAGSARRSGAASPTPHVAHGRSSPPSTDRCRLSPRRPAARPGTGPWSRSR